MAAKPDWDQMRAKPIFGAETPAHWPGNVRPVSLNGLCLFGVDGGLQLYWDGEPIEINKVVSLTTWQRIGAVLVTLSTVAGATVKVWRFILERGW